MSGREKIEAAFSREGTPEIPAVICYEDIYIRDHWEELTDCPWWYQQSPLIEEQLKWRRDVIARTGQDWFRLPVCASREERESAFIHEQGNEVFLIDKRTGGKRRLTRPRVGGWGPSSQVQSVHADHLPETFEEIEALVPAPGPFDAKQLLHAGRGDLAAALLAEFGEQLCPLWHTEAPLWATYGLWGFEGLMLMVAERPDLVAHACERYLARSVHSVRQAAALGAACIWIEDCLTDMLSPKSFETLNVRFLRPLVDEIRALGMKSIWYFCGDPAGKWEYLLSLGADALSLEEGKKGFVIDIDEVVGRVNGCCTVLGNLDAIAVLEQGTDEQLRDEIAKQIAAGRRNGSRFIMSLGSPVTPGTPVERVRLYCEMVRELGGSTS